MEEKKQTITRSYRVDDETAEKISSLARELGISQNAVFEMLLSAYELQQDVEAVPDAAKDIETFLSHLRSIQDAYHHVVAINLQTEERVRQEFQRKLESDQKQIADLLDTKRQLKEENSALRTEIESMIEETGKQTTEIARAEKAVVDLKKIISDKETLIDSLMLRLPAQAETDAKIKDMESALSALREELDESIKEGVRLSAAANHATAELDSLKEKLRLTKELHEKELHSQAAIAASDLRTAVAEARQEERDKAQQKIDALLGRIDELREKLDQQKDTIHHLQSASNQQATAPNQR